MRLRLPISLILLVAGSAGTLPVDAQEAYTATQVGELLQRLGNGMPGTTFPDQASAMRHLLHSAGQLEAYYKERWNNRDIREREIDSPTKEYIRQCGRGIHRGGCDQGMRVADRLGDRTLASYVAAAGCLQLEFDMCVRYAKEVEAELSTPAVRAFLAGLPLCGHDAYVMHCLIGIRATFDGSFVSGYYQPASDVREIRPPRPEIRYATAEDRAIATALGQLMCDRFADPPSCTDYVPQYAGLRPHEMPWEMLERHSEEYIRSMRSRKSLYQLQQAMWAKAEKENRSWFSKVLDSALPALEFIGAAAEGVASSLPPVSTPIPPPGQALSAAGSTASGGVSAGASGYRHPDCGPKNYDGHYYMLDSNRGIAEPYHPYCPGSQDAAMKRCRELGGSCRPSWGTAMPAF